MRKNGVGDHKYNRFNGTSQACRTVLDYFLNRHPIHHLPRYLQRKSLIKKQLPWKIEKLELNGP